jgi:hypothetical protein
MALKKIDVSDIDSAIAVTKDDELRQKEIEAQSDLALQIRLFMKDAPYIINEIREAASPMDAQKFSSAVSGNLQNSATEMARTFNANVKPMVDKMETARNCVIVPALTAYIIIVSIVWLSIFLALTIYANSQYLHSEKLSMLVFLIIFFWILTVALIVFLTKKFKWY